MKKTLIALAVMSASAGAFAQSNVQIYGDVEVGIERSTSGGVSTSIVGAREGLSAGPASYIGFRGVEDLGNGLSAKFVLEQGFNLDDGTTAAGTAFNRQSWVGLSSKNLGEVRLGNQFTPMRGIVKAVDPFGLRLAGNAGYVLGAGGLADTTRNAVTYVSPNVSGFSGQVQYVFGETANSMSDNRQYGVSGAYVNGPVLVGAAYQTANTNGVGVNLKDTAWTVGGTYDFGVVKAHAAYAQGESKDQIAATDTKLRNYLVGVSAPFGQHTVMASWVHNQIRDLDQGKTNQYSLGYSYSMSKRTSLYASYAHVTNQDNVALASATANGDSVNRYNVGIRHSF